jgi:phenylacetate-CoA ligase
VLDADLLLGRRVRRHYAAAEARREQQRAVDPSQQADIQLEVIRQVWQDAIVDVPHYAALVASGAAPRVLSSWQDVKALPELTRRSIQDQPQAFIRRSGPPEGYVKTGGSTATPLHVGMNQAERDLMRIVKLAAWQSLGYTRQSRLFIVWGHAHLLGTGWRGRVAHLRRYVADALLGYERVSAYRLSPAIAADMAERLIRHRPVGLIGYASALDLFARYAAGYRDRFHALDMKFVLATTEPPPRPDTIDILEDLFGCPVVQEYGGSEFGQVAFKRGRGPFETYGDLNYLEALPPQDGDSAHPVLLTSLYRRYVPLIRYRNGDALLDPHISDSGHVSAFAAVAGRLNDVVYLAAGDGVHSESVLHCVLHEAAVYSVQMVLRDDGVELQLVTGDTDRPALESRIRGRLRQVHPRLAEARFRYVEDLATTRAGKRRWFVDLRTAPPSTGVR